jgi:hypothetical protein
MEPKELRALRVLQDHKAPLEPKALTVPKVIKELTVLRGIQEAKVLQVPKVLQGLRVK